LTGVAGVLKTLGDAIRRITVRLENLPETWVANSGPVSDLHLGTFRNGSFCGGSLRK